MQPLHIHDVEIMIGTMCFPLHQTYSVYALLCSMILHTAHSPTHMGKAQGCCHAMIAEEIKDKAEKLSRACKTPPGIFHKSEHQRMLATNRPACKT